LKNRFKISVTTFILLTLLSVFSINADDTINDQTKSPTSENSVYPASFFEQYRPQNALEMIERLPGFNFDKGSNARGFGGNAGNVLIDGARPTSKSGGLRSALVRIPATQVTRIEILRGGVSSGEAAGQSIVANVIRNKSGTTGSWAYKQRWAPRGKSQPNIEAAISTKLGDWDSSFDIDIGGFPGYRTADIETIDSTNQLETSSDERLIELTEFAFINGEVSQQIGKGKLTLNARIGGDRYDQNTERDIFIGRLPEDNTRDEFGQLDIISKFKIAELGIDWTQTNDDWRWHMIGLGLVEEDKFGFLFQTLTETNGEVSEIDFSQESKATEFIGRVTYGQVAGSEFKPEFGLELAKNKLTSESVQFFNDEPVQLIGGDRVVEELRGEIFSSFIYTASKKLTFEGGLTIEVSNIKVSGDIEQQQTFKFLKPRLSSTYILDSEHQFTLEIERRVGQLNFDDFAASSQAADGRTISGNANLAPDKTSELALTYDWSFSERGSLKVRVFHQWRDDILEQIIIEEPDVQGLGNAGNATFWGFETDLDLPLDFVLKNGLLELKYINRDSSFDDSIINTIRTINGYTPKWLTFKLRQDLTEHKFAWGIEYFGHFTDTNFFVDEKQTFSGNDRLKIFIESSHFFGVKIQLEVKNINTAEFDRTRFIFEDNRGEAFEKTEIARRLRKPEIKLTFSRNF